MIYDWQLHKQGYLFSIEDARTLGDYITPPFVGYWTILYAYRVFPVRIHICPTSVFHNCGLLSCLIVFKNISPLLYKYPPLSVYQPGLRYLLRMIGLFHPTE
jgi:hypothetical protein